MRALEIGGGMLDQPRHVLDALEEDVAHLLCEVFEVGFVLVERILMIGIRLDQDIVWVV